MAETKHTPGPWNHNGFTRHDTGQVVHARTVWTKENDDEEPTLICYLKPDVFPDRHVKDDFEIDSNANLIAAAPDLYDVCRELVRSLSPETGREVLESTRGEMMPILRQALAAIAKAGGK